MPCTCKEFESERPEMKDSGFRDVDAAITTRDLAWLIKDMGIDWEALDEQEFDQPLGLYTGAGTIFGVTGGVMEAAIRTGYELVTGQPIPDLEVTAVRGTEGFRTSVIKVGDLDLKVGVVTGLKNVVPVLEAVKNGTLDLHFIEVMTCPEGCVSGGGQPKLLMDTDREEPMRQEELRPLPMTENWPTGNLTKILRSKRFTKNSWKSPTAILRTISSYNLL